MSKALKFASAVNKFCFEFQQSERGDNMKSVKHTAATFASALAIAALGVSSANAADANVTGFYVGGNVGSSNVKIDTAGINAAVIALTGVSSAVTTAKENDVGFKLFGGYRFHPNFAVEAGYFNLGKFSSTTVTTGPAATGTASIKNDNGFNVDLVGIAPINEAFSLFARAGVQTSKTAIDAVVTIPGRGTFPASFSETSTSYKAGLGAQYDFTKSIGARAEWERYRVPGGVSGSSKADVDLFSLGLIVRF
jgi:OmpA-OmpF porin, OOP family